MIDTVFQALDDSLRQLKKRNIQPIAGLSLVFRNPETPIAACVLSSIVLSQFSLSALRLVFDEDRNLYYTMFPDIVVLSSSCLGIGRDLCADIAIGWDQQVVASNYNQIGALLRSTYKVIDCFANPDKLGTL